MPAPDPKTIAQERFALPDRLVTGIDIIGRFATDPPVTVRTLLDAIAERAHAGSRVIELGFGSGWLLEELPPALPNVQLAGLDLSPGNAFRAHDLYGPHTSIFIGDMERLPFRDATFDVIVTCWTLYFMRDIDAALEEMKRCLRPNGRFIATTSARDHEFEAEDLVAQAMRSVLGKVPDQTDIGRRFDLEMGDTQLAPHFPRVQTHEWRGEMVLPDLDSVLALWPKWEPSGLDTPETERARAEFGRLAAQRLDRYGAFRVSRHECAFICDLDS